MFDFTLKCVIFFFAHYTCLHILDTYSPSSYSKPGNVFLLLNTKEDTVYGTPLTFSYMEVIGAHQLFGYQHFFKISSFVFSKRKKLIQPRWA